ncbi:MAG TPA: autotransporter assembly complex family protein [Chlamydiales bacterium]|nr:autotransporter assembly complex family protein [Chlamydiales bacterium]
MWVILLFIPFLVWSDIPYEVHFHGLEDDPKTLKSVEAHSDIIQLKERPPASINGLRYRVLSDIPNMIQVLHSEGYYDATITNSVENVEGTAEVMIFIHPGPRYLLESYEIVNVDCKEKVLLEECSNITPSDLGVEIGKPISAQIILDAEMILLKNLANCGYPLAETETRSVVANTARKTVEVKVCIDPGPLARFGPITLTGIRGVNDSYISNKFAWKEGDIYSEKLVDDTQRSLIDTDLFSSVLISHADEVDPNGELPMKVRISESKHRSINVGVSYATNDGAGLTFGWATRNFRNRGEKLGVELNVQRVYSTGLLTYMIPEFYRIDQSFLFQAGAERQHITVYLANIYSGKAIVERFFNPNNYFSVGVKFENIHIHESIKNGAFSLLSIPIYYRYTTVENLLDPLSGIVISYKPVPYQGVAQHRDFFFKQELTTSFFAPLTVDKKIILGFRLQLGSIIGTPFQNIPFTHVFLGGSEDNLRGYRFKTVSPLNANGDPVGGRGALYFTFEPRYRITKSLGVVTFFDAGTVTLKGYPRLDAHWFKSVGLGLRYFTIFGPLRVDVGFPLDRRHLDPRYRFYTSIGQTF